MIVLLNWLVVPGERIGHLRIGGDASGLRRSDYGDAAMQKSWSTWIGKEGGRLDAFSAVDHVGARGAHYRIHLVRATSKSFRLRNGIHPGSPESSLRRNYPQAKAAGSYRAASGRVALWDDVRRGLAWEAANGRVRALIVHRKGERLTATLIPYLESPLQKG